MYSIYFIRDLVKNHNDDYIARKYSTSELKKMYMCVFHHEPPSYITKDRISISKALRKYNNELDCKEALDDYSDFYQNKNLFRQHDYEAQKQRRDIVYGFHFLSIDELSQLADNQNLSVQGCNNHSDLVKTLALAKIKQSFWS